MNSFTSLPLLKSIDLNFNINGVYGSFLLCQKKKKEANFKRMQKYPKLMFLFTVKILKWNCEIHLYV